MMMIAVYLLLVAAPIVAGLAYALLYSTELVGVLAEGFTLRHWTVVLASRETWSSFALSVYVASASVVATLLIALSLAIVLKPFLRHSAFSFALHIPLALPAAVAAFVVWQLFSNGGVVASTMLALGLIRSTSQFPSIVHDSYALGIIVTHTALAVPFFVLLFDELSEREGVERLCALAATLGASRSAQVMRVAVPVLMRAAVPNAVLLFVVVLGSYEIPLLLGLQSPQMLTVLVQRKYAMFDLAQKPEAFVLLLLVVPSVMLGAFLYRHYLAKE
jgi:putative spermidine/putrescine transport system permease protein